MSTEEWEEKEGWRQSSMIGRKNNDGRKVSLGFGVQRSALCVKR